MSASTNKIMILRPYWKPYVVFGVIWAGLSVWGSITLIVTKNATLWSPIVICLTMLILFWAWISLHSISIDKYAITYKALVPRLMTAPLADILGVEMRHIWVGKKIRSSGLQALIIRCSPTKQAKRRDIVINARLFDAEGLEKLVRKLEELGIKASRH